MHWACPQPLIRWFQKWLHFKWAFAYIPRHTGTFNCLSVRIVSSGGIKICSRKIGENYLTYSVRSCARSQEIFDWPFGGWWAIFQFMDNISSSVTEPKKRHYVFVFQSWKVTLDHIKSQSKFPNRLHINHCQSLKLVWQSNSVTLICPSGK